MRQAARLFASFGMSVGFPYLSSAGRRCSGRLSGDPDGIDANHWAKPRMKHAQPSGSEAGHFTVMDLSPRGSEMITISSDARLGAVFTGTKAGKVAGD